MEIERKSRYILSFAKVKKRRLLINDLRSSKVIAAEITESKYLQEYYEIKNYEKALRDSEKDLELCEKNKIQICVIGDENYPFGFLNMDTPPMVLRYRGNISFSVSSSFCIVGSRRALKKDMDFAFEAGIYFANKKYVILSGGAYGVDTAAHKGALFAEGITWAFLGGGLLKPYPARHIPVFEKISSSGGCVLSSFPVLQEPRNFGFIVRNEQMAALSSGVIVVSAGYKSGSLYTADAGFKMNKIVMSRRGSPGCNFLIAKGAVALSEVSDIEKYFDDSLNLCHSEYDCYDKFLIDLLPEHAFTAEYAVQVSGYSLGQVLSELQAAEISGVLYRLPGGKYKKIR